MLRVHVVPSGRHWLVKILGDTVETHNSATVAITAARVYIDTPLGGELFIHEPGTNSPTIERVRRRPVR